MHKNSLYIWSASETYVQNTSNNASPSIWHARLGHVGYRLLQQIFTKNLWDNYRPDNI